MGGHLSLLAPLPVEGVHPVPFLGRQSQFSGECLGHYLPLLNLDPPGSPATRSLRVSIPRLRKDRKPRSAVDEVMSEGRPTGRVQRSKGKAESGHPGRIGPSILRNTTQALEPKMDSNSCRDS